MKNKFYPEELYEIIEKCAPDFLAKIMRLLYIDVGVIYDGFLDGDLMAHFRLHILEICLMLTFNISFPEEDHGEIMEESKARIIKGLSEIETRKLVTERTFKLLSKPICQKWATSWGREK